jgi:plasmid stability protein
MDVTLTIQADEKLHAALRERAEVQGKTVSELAHEILREAVAERPLKERIGHLRGQLASLPEDPDPRRRQIRERNWRP